MTRLATALLVAAALLTGGCANADARRRMTRQAAVFRAHANDGTLPRQAREIATDAADYLEAEAYALGGDKPAGAK